jgi:glycosyltransferase involved in cell wall biosynthesis
MTTVLFDVTRLFMRENLTTPTGIDRVTEAYGRWLLARPDVRVVPVCTVGGFVSPMSLDRFRRVLEVGRPERPIAETDWNRLMTALQSAPGDAETLRSAAGRNRRASDLARYATFGARALGSWRPTSIPSDALFLNVSHYGLEQGGLLEGLTRRGVRPVAMVHDLIPIVHPEYCSEPASGWHIRRIQTLLRHDALIIANSGSTAEELRAWATANDEPEPRMCVAPLGLEPIFTSGQTAGAVSRPYFICVGTIEPRKNLVFLLSIWRRLAATMGDGAPWLILAGKRGWENEEIIDHLDRSPPIRRFVHEVNDLTDDQLARLISGANALLAPSRAEGFDLPVAEAGALGTPVIASDIPVHRELARGASLLDPIDGPAWLAAIESAMRSRARTPAAAPPRWVAHFAIVGEALGLAS